jgi:hypothetical protein
MSAIEHGDLPAGADACESEEFLGILVTEDGRELGVREPINARPTFAQALADAQDFARRWPASTRAIVLRRTLGPSQPADR